MKQSQRRLRDHIYTDILVLHHAALLTSCCPCTRSNHKHVDCSRLHYRTCNRNETGLERFNSSWVSWCIMAPNAWRMMCTVFQHASLSFSQHSTAKTKWRKCCLPCEGGKRTTYDKKNKPASDVKQNMKSGFFLNKNKLGIANSRKTIIYD
jgi:hypothetical protein